MYKGLSDPSPIVRNASLFALGQFSEHLQVSYVSTPNDVAFVFCRWCNTKGIWTESNRPWFFNFALRHVVFLTDLTLRYFLEISYTMLYFLQPDISKYSSELLPILFDCLGKAGQHIDKDPRGVTKVHYALEMFVENLGKISWMHAQYKSIQHIYSHISRT